MIQYAMLYWKNDTIGYVILEEFTRNNKKMASRFGVGIVKNLIRNLEK